MLDPKQIRNSVDSIAARIQQRGFAIDVAKFTALEEQRKQLQVKMQDIQNERNVRSKEVGIAKANGKNVDEALRSLKELSDSLKQVEEQFSRVQTELDDFLAHIPNMPHETVPVGKSEKDNQVVRTWS